MFAQGHVSVPLNVSAQHLVGVYRDAFAPLPTRAAAEVPLDVFAPDLASVQPDASVVHLPNLPLLVAASVHQGASVGDLASAQLGAFAHLLIYCKCTSDCVCSGPCRCASGCVCCPSQA